MGSEVIKGTGCELLDNEVAGEAEIEPYIVSKVVELLVSCEFGKDRASDGCPGEGGSW